MKYVINGNFLYGPVLGVQRYAREITRKLDELIKDKPYEVEIVMPSIDSERTSVFPEKYQAMYNRLHFLPNDLLEPFPLNHPYFREIL